jgi:5-methylcytosine-specific restriction endonuclease McrA
MSSRYQQWYELNKEKAREMKRIGMKKLRAENPDKYNAHSKKAKAREREKLFEIYGHTCVRCGFDDKRALTLDHKNNDGNIERAELGERGVYRKAKSSYQPDRYQILCMNCQFIKRTEDQTANQFRPARLLAQDLTGAAGG